MSVTQKRGAWLIAIIAVYFAITMSSPPNGMTPLGQKALALIICAVLSWAFVPVPIAISSLFFVFALHLTGVESVGPAIQNFATPTVFFVIASFMLAIAMGESGFSRRVSLKLAIVSDGSPTKAILLILCTASLISTVISDPPVAAAFTPIAIELINRGKCEKGRSNFAKALLIGISMAALIGGVGTPAGSSINVLALDLLEKEAGIKVSFIQWVAIGLPFIIIVTPLTAKVLTLIFPPEIKELPGMDEIKKEYADIGGITVKEKKFLGIMALLLVVWLTDKLHGFPLPLTTTMGAALFFLPGIDLLTWDNTKAKIGWDTILLIGAASSLGSALSKTGAALWLANISLSGVQGASTLVALAIVVVFTIVVHLIIPVSPAIVSVMAPTLVAFAATMTGGGNLAALLVVPMGFSASAAYMLPIDPVAMITYSQGYYSMGDFMKAGIGASIVWTIFMVLAMYLIGGPIGLI
jgi:sodium-dependent dicarboxylate transporter 2/3/5